MRLDEKNYVTTAEEAIKRLCEKPVTTSKIRNLLAMTTDIYNDVINTSEEELSLELVGRINYLHIRFIYEAGRDEKVKELVNTAHIIEHLNEVNGSRKQYILFSRYMEALVAFRKFYRKGDN